MDSLTHGLTGALLGKAFFAERYAGAPDGAREARLATFAATLGAVIPDMDVVASLLPNNDLSVIQDHRGVTHSLVCLPIFALLLAALTRVYMRRRGTPAPSWSGLAVIYAAGLASHDLLDLVTSFGTMIWSPWSCTRATWDLVFILDFTMTGIVLLPQVAAWVYRKPERSLSRALRMWAVFTACAWFIERLARAAGFPFSPSVVAAVGALLAALFFLPMRRGRGFQVRRSSWCRGGVYALLAYLLLCAAAHRAALQRVEQFAAARRLRVEKLGALPLPPSAAHWAGLIRTTEGVYETQINLWSGPGSDAPREYQFYADAMPNGYVAAARQLPKVKVYLWFARFPVFRVFERGGRSVVEISDLRFFGRRRRPPPFTFEVTFDAGGRVAEQGWAGEAR